MKLSLHRVENKPDWADVPLAERNVWQRAAAKTNGVFTPGNVVTILGAALSGWGIGMLVAHHIWWAIILLAIGRLLDIVDGMVADRTGTKSGLGEILDAVIDKFIISFTVIGMIVAQVAPLWLLIVFILPHLIITVIANLERAWGIRVHPSRLGKTTALLAWLAIPLVLLVTALNLDLPNIFVLLAYLFMLVSAGFGFVTAHSYFLQINESRREAKA
jgi:phosphatidylglycerophosphate synthase